MMLLSYIIPDSDRIIDFNPVLCDIFGYQPEEVYYLNIELLFSNDPPYSFEDAQPKIRAAADGSPQIFEWQTADHSGKKLWVEISIKKISLLKQPLLLIFVRKISERKKTEDRLYRLINIVDQIGEGVATADLNGIITYVNQAWANMHGYEMKSLIGKHLSMFHSDEQNSAEVIPFNKKVLRMGVSPRRSRPQKIRWIPFFNIHVYKPFKKTRKGVLSALSVLLQTCPNKKRWKKPCVRMKSNSDICLIYLLSQFP